MWGDKDGVKNRSYIVQWYSSCAVICQFFASRCAAYQGSVATRSSLFVTHHMFAVTSASECVCVCPLSHETGLRQGLIFWWEWLEIGHSRSASGECYPAYAAGQSRYEHASCDDSALFAASSSRPLIALCFEGMRFWPWKREIKSDGLVPVLIYS